MLPKYKTERLFLSAQILTLLLFILGDGKLLGVYQKLNYCSVLYPPVLYHRHTEACSQSHFLFLWEMLSQHWARSLVQNCFLGKYVLLFL